MDQYDAIRKQIKELNSQLDIVSVLEYFGMDYEESSAGRYKAICPFHNDTSPSLHLYTENDHGEDSWSCFVCNDNGDCFRFIQQMADDHSQAKKIAEAIANKSGGRIVSAKHKAIQKRLQLKKKVFIIQNDIGVRYREWLITLRDTDKYEKACERVDSIFEEIDALLGAEDYEEAREFIEDKLENLEKYER